MTINGEVIYLRLLAVNAFKKVLERVVSFVPVLPSIFNEDGSMISCVKYDFMHKLGILHEDKIGSIQSLDCIIFDAMAILNTNAPNAFQTVKLSFIDMAEQFLHHILRCSRTENAVAQMNCML